MVGVMKEKAQLSNYFRSDVQCIFIPYTVASQVWYQPYTDVVVWQAVDATKGPAAAMDESVGMSEPARWCSVTMARFAAASITLCPPERRAISCTTRAPGASPCRRESAKS